MAGWRLMIRELYVNDVKTSRYGLKDKNVWKMLIKDTQLFPAAACHRRVYVVVVVAALSEWIKVVDGPFEERICQTRIEIIERQLPRCKMTSFAASQPDSKRWGCGHG